MFSTNINISIYIEFSEQPILYVPSENFNEQVEYILLKELGKLGISLTLRIISGVTWKKPLQHLCL